MTIQDKKSKIEHLKSQIDDLLFKIEAYKLKAKYAKSTAEALEIAYTTFQSLLMVKMLYAQVQIIQSIPLHPKGGLAIVGNKQPEVIR